MWRRFKAHFVEAVKRRMRSAYPVAMSVSGGLDSSSVFCQAETLRRAGAVAAPSLRRHFLRLRSPRDRRTTFSVRYRSAVRRQRSTGLPLSRSPGSSAGPSSRSRRSRRRLSITCGASPASCIRARPRAAHGRCCQATGAIRCCSPPRISSTSCIEARGRPSGGTRTIRALLRPRRNVDAAPASAVRRTAASSCRARSPRR